MAYSKEGNLTELANKIGHIKLIEDPMIQRLIETFEDVQPVEADLSGLEPIHIDLTGDSQITQIITVDGGHQLVPNIARPERQVGFIQIAAQLIKLETLEYLNRHKMADPREIRGLLGQFVHHTLASIPIAGVRFSGLTVRESLRETIHRFINHYQLYDALAFLVYRQWQPKLEDFPAMNCINCKKKFELPRNEFQFKCPHCNEHHRLSDYLGLLQDDAEDRPRTDIVSNFRAVLEVLVLFSFIIKFRNQEAIMNKTLFILDGPLLLRAQLSRLVEPIRALIAHQLNVGKSLFLVGVEKGGELSNFAVTCKKALPKPGDLLILSPKFVVEQIHGRFFDETTYRNRVNYGTKVVLRAGEDHILSLNVPTGEFNLAPELDDLIGIREMAKCLPKLLSFSHENALIPLVLINSEASISNRPSGGILAQFVDQILRASNG